MNAFEDIVRRYLEAQDYWVRQSVKVEITKEQKVMIGKPSMPRPEIDLVAYNAKKNELILIEVKSYLDSYGVYLEAFTDQDDRGWDRYKILNNKPFQRIVTEMLVEEYTRCGLVRKNVNVNYGLAAGNIHRGYEESMPKYFNKKKWLLITPQEISDFIESCAKKGYEDDLVTMTAKLLKNTPGNTV